MNLGNILFFVFYTTIFSIFALESTTFAHTPQTQGLAGSGRAGIPKESFFSNPAAVALLKQNTAVLSYTKTNINDLGSGGRTQVAGVYDGSSVMMRGGLAYIREARRISTGSGSRYADHTTVRAVAGANLWQGLLFGLKGNYTMRKDQGEETKYFHGDMGLIYPIFTDLTIGATAENISDVASERPRELLLGGRYDLMGPMDLYGDLGRIVSPTKNGKYSWAIGTELQIFEELVARAGLHKDSVEETRGYSLGLSWFSPRTAFEYAFRRAMYRPRQVDHVFGISFVF